MCSLLRAWPSPAARSLIAGVKPGKPLAVPGRERADLRKLPTDRNQRPKFIDSIYSKPTSKCDHFEVGLPAGNQLFLFLFSIFKVDSLYYWET